MDLLVPGIATFAVGYLAAPLAFGAVDVMGRMLCDRPHGDCHGSGTNLAPLLIPVAGPLVYYGHHADVEKPFWWAASSAAQVAGLAMVGYSLATRESRAATPPRVAVVPYAAPGGGGATMSGSF